MCPTPRDDDDKTNALVVAIHPAATSGGVDADWVYQKLDAACRKLGLQRVSLNVVIVDDAFIADMHQQFLDTPGTTDVITFDLSDPPGSGADAGIDGEIYVCVDEARRRAAPLGHTVNHELLLYALHGVLHLLGYDDHAPDQHRIMHEKEDQLLRDIGVGAVFKTSDQEMEQ